MAISNLARPMNWCRKIWPFVLAEVLYLIGEYYRGYWFPGSSFRNFCRPYVENGKLFCNSPYVEQGFALIAAGKVFLAVAVILLFANAKGFRRWLKFSYFYVPIATILVLWLFPFDLPPGITIPLESGVYDFGFLYILITLGIVLYSRWKN